MELGERAKIPRCINNHEIKSKFNAVYNLVTVHVVLVYWYSEGGHKHTAVFTARYL